MSDDKKAPWKRCSWCGERVWNDPIDWEAHRNTKDPVCPAILRRMIVKLRQRLEDLERPAQVAAPTIDFGAVEEPDEDGPEDPEEEQEVPDLAPVFEEVTTLQVAPAIDDYDDEDDDEEQAPISRPVMR